jgi:cyclopropane fatty-acyl-phospholipid synthase-like methyltransferase
MQNESATKQRFQQMYDNKAPWDIGGPQPAFVKVADRVHGSILDVGCGTGELALFFAQRGHSVTGIDFLEWPIAQARQKAAQRGIQAEFLVFDALQLSQLGRVYDSILDCGLFHVFDDVQRERYVHALKQVTKTGSSLFLLCFSDKEPPGDGPRRISQSELRAAFSDGWQIESIQPERLLVRQDLENVSFSPGGPLAWFCIAHRI